LKRDPGPALVHILFGLLVLAYFFAFFFRVSAAVILPRLASEIGMSAAMTGFLSSLYYYSYAAVQPLCGSLNDRWGPLRVVAAGLFVAAAGASVFMFASDPWSLAAGRLLTGLGLGPMFSGALVFQANAFPPHRYSFYSSITLAVGNLGAVVSVGPLGLALDRWGRGSVFLFLALASLLLAGLLLLKREDDPVLRANQKSQRRVMGLREQLRTGFSTMASCRELRSLTLLWSICAAATLSFQGLWSVAWYQTAYGPAGNAARGWASAIGLGVMAGTLLGGRILPATEERLRALKLGFCINLGAWILLWLGIYWLVPFFLTGTLGFLVGVTSGILMVHCPTAVNEMAPRSRAGAVLGVANMLVMVCAVAFQWGTGAILGRFHSPAAGAYSASGFLVTYGVVIAVIASSAMTLSRMRNFAEAVRKAAAE